MEKIEFKDLPDTTTPLSADNLNLLQDNVENEFTNKGLKLMWQNQNPASTFNSQNINLQNEEYDYLIWIFGFYTGNLHQKSIFTVKEYPKVMIDFARDYNPTANTYYVANYFRNITQVSEFVYNIDYCQIKYSNDATGVQNNNFCIPLRIYGGKF